jgi:hypothetical protein
MATRADRDTKRQRDFEAAWAVMGTTEAKQLQWVVAWAREDPTHWHSAVRTAYGDALWLLVIGPELSARMPPAAVDACHAAVRHFLRALTTGPAGRAKAVDLPADPGYREAAVRASAPGARPAIYSISRRGGQFEARLLRRVADMLIAHGANVIACPGCADVFVARHKQRFCSTKCNQRTRNARKAQLLRAGKTPEHSGSGGVPKNVPKPARIPPKSSQVQPREQTKTR